MTILVVETRSSLFSVFFNSGCLTRVFLLLLAYEVQLETYVPMLFGIRVDFPFLGSVRRYPPDYGLRRVRPE